LGGRPPKKTPDVSSNNPAIAIKETPNENENGGSFSFCGKRAVERLIFIFAMSYGFLAAPTAIGYMIGAGGVLIAWQIMPIRNITKRNL